MNKKEFATAINCMDGRVQLPVINYIQKEYNKEYIDAITFPGPIKKLSEMEDKQFLNALGERIDISVNKHKSRLIAVIGHFDCAGNPVGFDIQKEQIIKSVNNLKKLYSFIPEDVEIVGLWVSKDFKVVRLKIK